MEDRELIQRALRAKEESTYTPYSGYKVGAAVEMDDGSVYTGGNIEIVSYSPTCCAERTAIFKAVSEGHRKIKTVVATSLPCGVCRQVIAEFGADARIIVAKSEDDYQVYTLDELLPHHFATEELGDKYV
ncbi:cytidine deaminase [Peptoniphilus equinus]|uniref:Cytidine deaminase n=1 Tax=Peptoniphilus equinus TaxID=3016343 RepID=A0ABY7QVZ4_9FIRM|nr:cytidine deaminase [Peptoniphilus equinus]WBW50378.1 cytidine deaminase [Peptoniphilus equinus]